MMYPVLTVEGKETDVYAVFYRDNKIHSISILDDEGVARQYHDINEDMQYYREKPLQVDFEKQLHWRGRHDEIYHTLDKAINDNQARMQYLANEIADHDNSFIPCPQKDERNRLKMETVGLMDAQEIVHGFMLDDVDLSGGEC